MIKGDLPWKYKTYHDIFAKDQRARVKDGPIIVYLKTLDDKF